MTTDKPWYRRTELYGYFGVALLSALWGATQAGSWQERVIEFGLTVLAAYGYGAQRAKIKVAAITAGQQPSAP